MNPNLPSTTTTVRHCAEFPVSSDMTFSDNPHSDVANTENINDSTNEINISSATYLPNQRS